MIIRKLWAWEWERLRGHLLRLESEERRMRFGQPVGDAFIHQYCDRIDRPRTTVVGCFVGDVLRGVAELVRIPGGIPASAEIALSVERAFQGQGIGGRLLQKALLLARNRFVDTVHLICLPENERMRRLARRFGASVAVHDAGSEGRIQLLWPSYLTLLEEATADGQALASAVFELPVEQMVVDGNEQDRSQSTVKAP